MKIRKVQVKVTFTGKERRQFGDTIAMLYRLGTDAGDDTAEQCAAMLISMLRRYGVEVNNGATGEETETGEQNNKTRQRRGGRGGVRRGTDNQRQTADAAVG